MIIYDILTTKKTTEKANGKNSVEDFFLHFYIFLVNVVLCRFVCLALLQKCGEQRTPHMNKLISIFFRRCSRCSERKKKQVNKKFWEICNRTQQVLVHAGNFTVPTKSSWQTRDVVGSAIWTFLATTEEFPQFSMGSLIFWDGRIVNSVNWNRLFAR